MATWTAPKVNWQSSDIPTAFDFNRIENNEVYLNDAKAPLASPALSGTPTVPTAAASTQKRRS